MFNRQMHALVKTLLVGTALVLPLAPAWAGPLTSGGGQSGPCGDLFDFCEETLRPLVDSHRFNPVSDRVSRSAIQEKLYPWLSKLEKKVPGSAQRILQGLESPSQMDWYLTDAPIAPSGDECLLLQSNNTQIAKQVGNKVVISRQWIENHDDKNRAGLILHELLVHARDTSAQDCTTSVRKMVRMIADSDRYSEAALADQLGKLQPGDTLYTADQARQIASLLKDSVLKNGCVQDPKNPELETLSLSCETLARVQRMSPDFPMPGFTGFYYPMRNATTHDAIPGASGPQPPVCHPDSSAGTEGTFFFPGGECSTALARLKDSLGLPGNDSDSALIDLVASPDADRTKADAFGMTKYSSDPSIPSGSSIPSGPAPRITKDGAIQ